MTSWNVLSLEMKLSERNEPPGSEASTMSCQNVRSVSRRGSVSAAARVCGATGATPARPTSATRYASTRRRLVFMRVARHSIAARLTSVKKICETILDAIGHTPMVRLNTITRGHVKAEVLAKLETFNPGNSIKDRMAVRMIEDAERRGLLVPGGTIIEGTSGNTGMGLAIAAVVKGYKCIFTTTDKQSKEKIDALRAFGAEVIVCPTNVDPEDPR